MSQPSSDKVSLQDSHSLELRPGLPAPLSGLENLYILYYMERPPHATVKFFKSSKDFRTTIEWAKHYCQMMRYRFLTVSPFISDLDKELKASGSPTEI